MKIYDTNALSKRKDFAKGHTGDTMVVSALDDALKEISMLRGLNHNNIISIHEVLHDQNREKIYLIMEYCEKGSFLTWNPSTSTFTPVWSSTRLTEQTLRHIFRQIAFGIYYLHSQFIVHYDLKPQNILLTQDLCVKISDFDQSVKIAWSNSPKKPPGTYHFFPPECISSTSYNNAFQAKAVDIWGVGLILYAAVYGVLPYNGNNIGELFKNIDEKQ